MLALWFFLELGISAWIGWLSHTRVMCVTVTLMDPAETQATGTLQVQIQALMWKRNIAAIEKHTLESQSFNSYGLYLPPGSREWFC